jgi:hypothetical protein
MLHNLFLRTAFIDWVISNMVWRYTLTEIYSRAKTYIWRKAHNLENLEENVIIITGEDNSLRSHCLKPDFIRVFALFSFCYYFILRFVLLCFVDHCLCLCLFSFGHCIVCLLAIVLSVFRITASDYPFGFFSSTFAYSNINSSYSTLLIAFVD